MCGSCGQNMMESDGCTHRYISFNDDKDWYKRDTKTFDGERCFDCNTKEGHTHHRGCDEERCPKCGGQLITCDCINGNTIIAVELPEGVTLVEA